MRTLGLSIGFVPLLAAPLAAQEPAGGGGGGGLMSLQFNLMFWTLIIFGVLYWVLSRFAFGPITAAVEKREKALEEAIEGAKRDREAAAKLLEDHRAQLEGARGEAQKLIADGRALAEQMRSDLLEQTRKEQQEMLERARRDIESERDKAIAQMRREAVELALAGASKVIERNLDSAQNRQLVESYLSSLGTIKVSQS